MSRVVFVGNVPYNMGEDQLIDVFKSVGQVIGFRLVFDRETGKPRGYGFCEFADHETALSAVRNLNNTDVGGRPLRIDLAESDPVLEGKTTVRGEIIDSGPDPRGRGGKGASGTTSDPNAFLSLLPAGLQVPQGASALDYISQTLATMQPGQLMEVLAQMKAFMITHPDQARTLLVSHPQLAYALFQSLLLNKIVDSAILQRMLAATTGGGAAAPSGSAGPPRPPQAGPTHQPSLSGSYNYPPPPASAGYPAQSAMGVPPPAATGMYPLPHQPTPTVPGMAPPSFYGPPATPSSSAPPSQQSPPASATATAAPVPAPEVNDTQRAMLLQVLSMTPEQINNFSENERSAIMQLRNQFMGTLGGAPGS